jgi:hypothetical protein
VSDELKRVKEAFARWQWFLPALLGAVVVQGPWWGGLLPNADHYELGWLTVFAAALFVGLSNLYQAYVDRQVVLRQPVRRDLSRLERVALDREAINGIRREACRVLATGAFAVAGLLAVLSPPGASPREWVINLLMFGGVVIMLNSILDSYERHRLLREGVE